MDASQILSLKSLCSAAAASAPNTVPQAIWTLVTALWPWYWIIVVLSLGGWIFFELKTRNGTAHYNSKNGFSPLFNSFVGVCTYALLQGLVYLLLRLFLGDAAYCVPWSWILHIAVFGCTGLFLHAVGFWPELRGSRPGRRRKSYRRPRRR